MSNDTSGLLKAFVAYLTAWAFAIVGETVKAKLFHDPYVPLDMSVNVILTLLLIVLWHQYSVKKG